MSANDPIFLSVDMGEGGPVSDFDRVVEEGERAIARALAGHSEMLHGSPVWYDSARIYQAFFARFAQRDWTRATELDERGQRRVVP